MKHRHQSHSNKHTAAEQRAGSSCSAKSSHSGGPHAHSEEHLLDTGVPQGTIYTCPMHPQIRQVGPGHCPICGMALEPEMPSEHEDATDINAVRTKFWVSVAFTVPVVVIAMLPHLIGMDVANGTARALRGAELLLTAPVVLW